MDSYADQIITEMAKIYSLFCLPVIIINTETGESQIETRWSDTEAEKTYNNLGCLLQMVNRRGEDWHGAAWQRY